ncbi:tripartite tricarboxylate transporter substrate binding protein [Ramlibacter sp. 2FC]|uniref:Bug family tripartite tricarboxylate transporter substrate binding protein n=1 Tax=Ramlibacter sp. 2FC TaxID=2502188 RepID=UPI0010F53487|nr:tripartite tricarboxylate transporter substrate binding protein [Ramlibacter sp. 2FC]
MSRISALTLPRRLVLAGLALGLAAAALPRVALAQASDKPIKFILPVASGSGVDTITRATSVAVSKALGHAVVVENQPGAGGVIGTAAMIKSPPDGFTLSVVSNNHVIYPSVLKSVPFDPVGDITPITVMGTTPLVLVVNPKVPAHNAKELVALLKSKPGQFNFASSGNGTILHLAAEMFVDEAGVKAKHIPYKGVGPMLTDLMGGQVEFGVLALPSIQAHLKSGALRAIGTSSAQRLAAAPEIPTFAEQGLPGYVVEGWFAVVGPRNLPAADVKRIHAAFSTAFATAEVKETMAKQGNSISMSSPEAATAFFRSELAKYSALVKKAGIEPQ